MIDRTTKVLLAVIAVCLAILAIRSFQAAPATATKEVIVKVDVVRVGGRPVYSWDIKNLVEGSRK
ncbi:MAG: hypothetical protein HWN68_13995 [Desulfobacterales bacterium]|nr:hypothetical protein [Desulfobacterales bacterium]